jgi:hypothetical protein
MVDTFRAGFHSSIDQTSAPPVRATSQPEAVSVIDCRSDGVANCQSCVEDVADNRIVLSSTYRN